MVHGMDDGPKTDQAHWRQTDKLGLALVQRVQVGNTEK